MIKSKKSLIAVLIVFNVLWFGALAGIYLSENNNEKSIPKTETAKKNKTDDTIGKKIETQLLQIREEKNENTAAKDSLFKTGKISINFENVSADDSPEIVKSELAYFPEYNLVGINRIAFRKTPIDEKGIPYTMYYYSNGTILISPGYAAEQNIYAKKFNHELGHNIVARFLIGTADFDKFDTLHNNRSDWNNFISKEATRNTFEDVAESAAYYAGNTKLFYRISKKNKVMKEKFVIIADKFCRENICTVWKPEYNSGDEFSPYDFNGITDRYGGFYTSDRRREEIIINDTKNFTEFGEKLS